MVMDQGGNLKPFNSVQRATLQYSDTSSHKNMEIKAATSFRLMEREALKHSIQEYSDLCGIPVEQITKTAKDFTDYGTKAGICQYHGAGNYTNGTYAALSVALLNVLIGSIEVKGGYLTSGGAAASWKRDTTI